MMRREASFEVGGKSYTILFDFRAWFLFEEQSGRQLGAASLWTEGRPILYQELAWAVLAGLEAHRIETRESRRPWTMDDVLRDVLTSPAAEDVMPVYRACAEAFTVGTPKAGEADEGKAPPTEG